MKKSLIIKLLVSLGWSHTLEDGNKPKEAKPNFLITPKVPKVVLFSKELEVELMIQSDTGIKAFKLFP